MHKLPWLVAPIVVELPKFQLEEYFDRHSYFSATTERLLLLPHSEMNSHILKSNSSPSPSPF